MRTCVTLSCYSIFNGSETIGNDPPTTSHPLSVLDFERRVWGGGPASNCFQNFRKAVTGWRWPHIARLRWRVVETPSSIETYVWPTVRHERNSDHIKKTRIQPHRTRVKPPCQNRTTILVTLCLLAICGLMSLMHTGRLAPFIYYARVRPGVTNGMSLGTPCQARQTASLFWY